MYLTKKHSLDSILAANNVADLLSESDRVKVGVECIEGYKLDLQSRKKWEQHVEKYMELAMQIVERKDYPWKNASNIKYPLLSTACLQYSSRAYSSIIPDKQVVKSIIYGADDDGKKHERARKISQHMNYQLFEQMDGWEEDMDRLLFVSSIVGCGFKKTYYDKVKEKNVSAFVLPRNLVVDYWTKTLETAHRISHVVYLRPNDITTMERAGLYLAKKYVYEDKDEARVNVDERHETKTIDMQLEGESHAVHDTNDDNAPDEYIEQHNWLDLDGDGYLEPYITTVCVATQELKRIEPRFSADTVYYKNDIDGLGKSKSRDVVRIEADNYFTKYGFIPAPDGSYYDYGFGQMIGPLNDAANTILNQLVDAGTLSNTGGGFIGKGLRAKGGTLDITPGKWVFVDAGGDDIRKNMLPFPIKEPSGVLFNLLGTIISAGQKLSSITEPMTGESAGDRASAATTAALIDQGLKVFSAIMRRAHRSLKDELKKLYKLNKDYLKPVEYYRVIDGSSDQENQLAQQNGIEPSIPMNGTGQMPPNQGTEVVSTYIERTDYQGDDTDVVPNSNPEAASEAQLLQKAQALMQFAQDPDFDGFEIKRRFLQYLNVPEPEKVLPLGNKNKQPPPDPKQIEMMAKMEIEREKSHIARANEEASSLVKKVEALKVLGQMQADNELGEIDQALQILQRNIGGLDAITRYDNQEDGNDQQQNGLPGMDQNGGNGAVPQTPDASAGLVPSGVGGA